MEYSELLDKWRDVLTSLSLDEFDFDEAYWATKHLLEELVNDLERAR